MLSSYNCFCICQKVYISTLNDITDCVDVWDVCLPGFVDFDHATVQFDTGLVNKQFF